MIVLFNCASETILMFQVYDNFENRNSRGVQNVQTNLELL